ncbi:MAG: hypothetical protein PHH57_09210, partial [Candidatus Omnitrophica bacterium]|nr:hypothetical protein [Candidatus Omnitrophota bacterium]
MKIIKGVYRNGRKEVVLVVIAEGDSLFRPGLAVIGVGGNIYLVVVDACRFLGIDRPQLAIAGNRHIPAASLGR